MNTSKACHAGRHDLCEYGCECACHCTCSQDWKDFLNRNDTWFYHWPGGDCEPACPLADQEAVARGAAPYGGSRAEAPMFGLASPPSGVDAAGTGEVYFPD